MIWLTAIGCLVVGVVIGVVFSGRLNSSASRVQELEDQIRDIKDNHLSYRDNVSDHFSMTADLVQHMTESYREVYQHLASGAQDLCSNEVASKLLPAGSDAVFESNEESESTGGLNPPKDYIAQQDPSQKGTILPAGSAAAVAESNEESESTDELNPPKDYVAKRDPSQEGAISAADSTAAVAKSNEESESTGELNPPKDYATKQDPSQKGALSEDFGINKSIPLEEEEV